MNNIKQCRVPTFTEATLTFLPSLAVMVLASASRVELQAPLLVAIVFSGLLGLYLGNRWKDIEHSLVKGMANCAPVLAFLICIGATIGIWIEAGIIPAFVSYGLSSLQSSYFYAGACFVTAVVASMTNMGGALGTVGVALLVTAHGIGADLNVTVGALVSGSVLGQLVSPVNDLLPLALARGVDLKRIIRLFLIRLLPPFLAAEVLFLCYGFYAGSSTKAMDAAVMIDTIHQQFYISPLLFLPVFLLVFLIVRGVPTVQVLIINLGVSALFAMVFQGADLESVMRAMSSGYKPSADLEVMQMFARGGIIAFGSIMQLIMLATIWGALLKQIGVLDVIFAKLISLPFLQKRLVLQSHLLSIMISISTCAVIPAIIISGELLQEKYQQKGIEIEQLYRDLTASGFLASPVVPWTNIAFFTSGTLGINLLPAIPYLWFCWLYFIWVLMLGLWPKGLHQRHNKAEAAQMG